MLNFTNTSNPFSSAYSSIRHSLFTLIYPAPTIVNRGTRNFIGIQQLTRSISNYDQFCHPLEYDFFANVTNVESTNHIAPDHFEAMLIAEIEKNILYHSDIKYLICLGGNTSCYQVLIPEMIEIYKSHYKKAFLIGFNPPGVGMSPGSTANLDIYCDALKSIIDNLHNNHIPYSNIMVLGHSLGGGIAARVVAQYQFAGKNVSLFADRSMISLSEAAGSKLRRGIPTLLLKYTVGNLLYVLAKFLIYFFKLELDVAADFASINKIQPGAAHGMMAHEDEVLSDCCLSGGIEHPTPYFAHFKLRDEDPHRRSHSKVRRDLIAVGGEQTAEQYLHSVLVKFTLNKLSC